MQAFKENKLLVFSILGSNDEYLVQVNDDKFEYYQCGSLSNTPEFITDSNISISEGNITAVNVSIPKLCINVVINGIFNFYDINEVDKDKYYQLVSSKRADIFSDVRAFQEKYGLLDHSIYGFLPDENMKVKLNHLKEELDEGLKAYEENNLEEVCDALIDIIYIAGGTLELMNMPSNALWNDVQIRNMTKIRATKDNVGKRGTSFDVIKPPNFKSPRGKEIIDIK